MDNSIGQNFLRKEEEIKGSRINRNNIMKKRKMMQPFAFPDRYRSENTEKGSAKYDRRFYQKADYSCY